MAYPGDATCVYCKINTARQGSEACSPCAEKAQEELDNNNLLELELDHVRNLDSIGEIRQYLQDKLEGEWT